MNKVLNDLKRQGFQYTGHTAKEWQRAELDAKLKDMEQELKKFGSKARIVREVSETQFRNRKDRSVTLSIYVWYSPAHKQFLEEEKKKQRETNRRHELIRMVRDNNLTMDELTFMVNYKSALLIQEAINASKSIE